MATCRKRQPGVAQFGSVPDLGSGGRGFESRYPDYNNESGEIMKADWKKYPENLPDHEGYYLVDRPFLPDKEYSHIDVCYFKTWPNIIKILDDSTGPRSFGWYQYVFSGGEFHLSEQGGIEYWAELPSEPSKE